MTLSISQRALSGLSVKEATNSNELSVLSVMVGSEGDDRQWVGLEIGGRMEENVVCQVESY
jgi:hypothetical protein